jgi:hypothetical protein
MHPTRIFQTPLELENAFEKYKESLKLEGNQWLKVQYVGKEGDRVTDPQKVPYTLEGFKRYCRKHYGEVQHYFDNTDKYYDDFCVICRAIREEIREDQIIGGLLGFYNPSITQRLNGLTDKSEMTVKEQPLFPDEPN